MMVNANFDQAMGLRQLMGQQASAGAAGQAPAVARRPIWLRSFRSGRQQMDLQNLACYLSDLGVEAVPAEGPAAADWLYVIEDRPLPLQQAYADLKQSLQSSPLRQAQPRVWLLVMAQPTARGEQLADNLATAALQYLGLVVQPLGVIPPGEALQLSDSLARPLAEIAPRSSAALAFRRAAVRMTEHAAFQPRPPSLSVATSDERSI